MIERIAEIRAGIAALADRHGLPEAAALALAEALSRTGGASAQFNHPDLGGMGQWSAGGMTQIGDMFNAGLKAQVAALASDLSAYLARQPEAAAAPGQRSGWWPQELGTPASVGSQNDMAYAYFPESRRLAIRTTAGVTIYDAGPHAFTGAAQMQASGAGQDVTFATAQGQVRLSALRRLS